MADSSSIGSGPAAFVLCIEDNETRDQALLLIESIRAFGGRFAGSEIFAVAPRAGLGVDAATRARLDRLEVTYHEEPLNTVCPEYGSANRVYSAAWAADSSRAETLFVLDSDTLFLAEPAPIPDDGDLALRPVDVKGSASLGPGDPFDPYWQAVCQLAGLPIESLPFVETAIDRQRVRASYNGGYSVVRRDSGILQQTAELFTRTVRAGLRPYQGQPAPRIYASTGPVPPRAREYWGSNQAVLSVAAGSAQLRVELLDRRYNVPLHHLADPALWHDSWLDLRPIHLHYHWMLRAGHRRQAFQAMALLGVPADRLDWIAAHAPIGGFRRRSPATGAAAPGGARVASGTSRQLVICGMHRSATSLVASVLRESGLEIGKDLLGPGKGNRRGHFEDHEFWQLHEDMLTAAGCTALAVGDNFAPPPGADFVRRARQLVARRENIPLWGWKDPRTSLFLDFWRPLLPDASYVLLYRHPLEVALSLRRRATESEARLDPWAGIRAWEVYNRRLLVHLETCPERCFLAQVPALTDDLTGFVARLAGELDLPLREPGLQEIFSPEELAASFEPGELGQDWDELIPEALALYRRLEEQADLPGPGLERAGEPGRDLAALLEDLRQTRQSQGKPAPALASASWQRRLSRLQLELAQSRQSNARLQRRLAAAELDRNDAEARRDQLAASLAEIQNTRGYGLVAGWWRLAGRLRRRRPPKKNEPR